MKNLVMGPTQIVPSELRYPTPTPETRLQSMQAALKRHGLRDVKLFFSPDTPSKPSSAVKSNVVDFLDAYLKGRYKTVAKIGDAPVPI